MNELSIELWAGLAIGVAVLAWFGYLVIYGNLVGSIFYVPPARRRMDNCLNSDSDEDIDTPFMLYNTEDGPPGSPRGRVWDETERDIYQQRERNNKIRIRHHE